uniref:Uncharacterized protein n=1 Tax=Brassica oleracea var. oleracea TaxID=109376 RepID=A0A0D3BLF7_BRAOL
MSSLSSQNRDPSLLCLLRSRSRSTRLRSSGIRTSSMDQAELSTEQVLQRDIPWETYMTTKLISATDLQLLRRYDKKTESARAQLLDEVNLLQQLFSLSLSHTHIYRNLCQFLCVRSG